MNPTKLGQALGAILTLIVASTLIITLIILSYKFIEWLAAL